METDIIKAVGRNIAQHRKRQGITQTELGNLIGRSQGVISSWEKGVADPGSDNLILLSQILDVSPLDLLGVRPDGEQKIIMPDESMMPEIHAGDTLTIKENATYKDGDIVIVDTTHETGIIRRLFRFGVQITLLAFNPSITPICTDRHNVSIKGKVTDIHRRIKEN